MPLVFRKKRLEDPSALKEEPPPSLPLFRVCGSSHGFARFGVAFRDARSRSTSDSVYQRQPSTPSPSQVRGILEDELNEEGKHKNECDIGKDSQKSLGERSS